MDFEQLKIDAKLYLLDEIDKISNNKLKNACLKILNNESFCSCVGSRNHHHAFVGGLLVHTSEVMQAASALMSLSYSSKIDEDVVRTIVVYHDVGKIYDYCLKENGIEYTKHKDLIGHIHKSHAIFVYNYLHEVSELKETLTPKEYEQIQNIEHGILSHHGRSEWGSLIEPKTPEAIICHLADMYSAKNTVFIKKELIC